MLKNNIIDQVLPFLLGPFWFYPDDRGGDAELFMLTNLLRLGLRFAIEENPTLHTRLEKWIAKVEPWANEPRIIALMKSMEEEKLPQKEKFMKRLRKAWVQTWLPNTHERGNAANLAMVFLLEEYPESVCHTQRWIEKASTFKNPTLEQFRTVWEETRVDPEDSEDPEDGEDRSVKPYNCKVIKNICFEAKDADEAERRAKKFFPNATTILVEEAPLITMPAPSLLLDRAPEEVSQLWEETRDPQLPENATTVSEEVPLPAPLNETTRSTLASIGMVIDDALEAAGVTVLCENGLNPRLMLYNKDQTLMAHALLDDGLISVILHETAIKHGMSAP
jgi:hypothetical protein